jgi:hypothetical protein
MLRVYTTLPTLLHHLDALKERSSCTPCWFRPASSLGNTWALRRDSICIWLCAPPTTVSKETYYSVKRDLQQGTLKPTPAGFAPVPSSLIRTPIASPNLCVCVCVCVCVYTCVRVHTHTHISDKNSDSIAKSVCVCVCVCTRVCVYTCVRVHTHTHIFDKNSDSIAKSLSLSLSVLVCVCVHVCACAYTHTHISDKNSDSIAKSVYTCERVHRHTHTHTHTHTQISHIHAYIIYM